MGGEEMLEQERFDEMFSWLILTYFTQVLTTEYNIPTNEAESVISKSLEQIEMRV